MLQGSVFNNNKTQAVRLPAEVRFKDSVKKVAIRINGEERILCPVDHTWDSFFLSGEKVSDDFLAERAEQIETDREAL
ncbi:MAG: type II toxin-antitoxin system VapB family antitoxin [Methylobacter sp.]|nr:type II toxin-antitoxin system VapB family antitoxin [Methylobacter sp.]